MSSISDKFSFIQKIEPYNYAYYPLPRGRNENITAKVTAITFKDSPGYLKIYFRDRSIDLKSYDSTKGLKDCDIKISFNCTLTDFIKNKYTYDDIVIDGNLGSKNELSKYVQLFRVVTSYVGTRGTAYEHRRSITV